jgi:hypothetical protein
MGCVHAGDSRESEAQDRSDLAGPIVPYCVIAIRVPRAKVVQTCAIRPAVSM